MTSKADVTIRTTVDRFLSSARCRNPNTHRAYAAALDPLGERLAFDRRLDDVFDDELAETMEELWSHLSAATWNARRAAAKSWLDWCAKNSYPAPNFPAAAERRPEVVDQTKAIPITAITRQLKRKDVPLREKTLWHLLYESAARASEVLALNVEDLELEARRAKIVSKGGDIEYIYWASGTARLLPRLLKGRTAGPVFLSERRPPPARRPALKNLCPQTGRARLGYDRARILFGKYTGWSLHQLRHSAATHLGEKNTELQLIMAKTRHKNPRTVMRYVKPGAQAVAEVTEVLDLAPPRNG